MREAAAAHLAAAERGGRGENYLLGGSDASYLEVVRIIGELTGCPVPTRPMPALALKAVGLRQMLTAEGLLGGGA